MLAGELALAGVDVAIVEQRPNQDLDSSRAGGLFARTLEVLDQRGIAERFIEHGQKHPAHAFAGIILDAADLPSRFNYVLGLPQREFEPILADWVAELGVTLLRGRAVTGFTQDDEGVALETTEAPVRAQYLVGCDGGRSVVRKTVGIDFAGLDASTSWLIGEVEMDDELPVGMRYQGRGNHAMNRLGVGGAVRFVLTEDEVGTGEPTLAEVRAALINVYGTDFGLRDPHWLSRFTDMTRQAVAYRDRRVLLAGDAAHIHPPHGGQGLQTGVQDAVNLGWKLAQVVNGTSPESLLDTYHAERRPVAARVLRNTMTQVALSRGDDRTMALREAMTELLQMDEPRRRIIGMLSGLDIRYDLGDGHPLIGTRMPNLDLRDARPVLLNEGEFDAQAALVRPDGHIAWAGDPSDPALPEAFTKWFGPAQ
jgi:3-(3-hydroxy-phenyl)propionate hydroxylase